MEENGNRNLRGYETGREKFLVFSLNEDSFGFALSTVKEVIGLTEITPIPNVPSYFRGLINLRGRIISVIDLKSKLNILNKEKAVKNEFEGSNKKSIVIIDSNETVFGIVVDTVDAVAEFNQNQIDKNQAMNDNNHSKEYIFGVAKTEDKKLTLLLDVKKVINIDDLSILKMGKGNVKLAS